MPTEETLIDLLNELRERINEVLEEDSEELTESEGVPESDMQVGDLIRIANINKETYDIEILNAEVIEVGLRDGNGYYNRVRTLDDRRFKVPILVGDTRLGTKVIEIIK